MLILNKNKIRRDRNISADFFTAKFFGAKEKRNIGDKFFIFDMTIFRYYNEFVFEI